MKHTSKQVNKDFLIRIDGILPSSAEELRLEIHSAIGFSNLALILDSKLDNVLDKVYNKGLNTTKVKPFHGLTITFYSR